jgi:hypothetical protein
MRALNGVLATLAIVSSVVVVDRVPAVIRLLPGGVDVNELVARSSLVCRGRVTTVVREAEGFENADGELLTERALMATVQVERCYKGPVQSGEIGVAFVESANPLWPSLTLQAGEYGLLFLNAVAGQYVFADPFLGKTPMSPSLGPAPLIDGDPVQALAADLRAALTDRSRDVVVAALRLLAGLRPLGSLQSLRSLLPATDREVEGLVYLTLLEHGDYSLLSQAGSFVEFVELETIGPEVHAVRAAVAGAIGGIADDRARRTLETFTTSSNRELRLAAVRALREIRNPASVPILVARLDDTDGDIRFGALMALAEAERKSREWAPAWAVFAANEAPFIQRWKDWWSEEGRRKRSPAGTTDPLHAEDARDEVRLVRLEPQGSVFQRATFSVREKATGQVTTVAATNVMTEVASLQLVDDRLLVWGSSPWAFALSIIDLRRDEQVDFIHGFGLTLSPTGRLVAFSKLQPRHAQEAARTDVVLVYNLRRSAEENRVEEQSRRVVRQGYPGGTAEGLEASEDVGVPVYPEANAKSQTYLAYEPVPELRHDVLPRFWWLEGDRKLVFVDRYADEVWLVVVTLPERIARAVKIDVAAALRLDPSSRWFAREVALAKEKFLVEELVEQADGTVRLRVNRGTARPTAEFTVSLPR